MDRDEDVWLETLLEIVFKSDVIYTTEMVVYQPTGRVQAYS